MIQLTDVEKNTIDILLQVEHSFIAKQLSFIKSEPTIISEKLLYQAIGLIDKLSRNNDQHSKKLVITLSSILWSYKKPEWTGLKDFLILILSRVGYGPSAMMVDNEFDLDNNQYSPMQSLITELSVSLHHFKHEVQVSGRTFLLTKFQKDVWDTIIENDIVGISAPTSAGKSFIILLKAIDLLLEKPGAIIYIVPTLSLVSQVSNDFRKMLNMFGLTDYEVLNSYFQDYGDTKKIFVLTQERAIAAFSQKNKPFDDIRMLVADEIQNIERVGDENEERSKILYDTLIDFRYQQNPDKIIVSGPRVDNIDNLATQIFGEEAEEEETKTSPVVSFTYSIAKPGKKYVLKQYSSILDMPREIVIENDSVINGFGKKLYNEQFHDYLRWVLKGLGTSSINIIFSPKPNQARKTAEAICSSFPRSNDKKLNDLRKYIANTVHPQYSLCTTLERGIGYHHGRLPHHVRRVLEKALSEKLVKNIVCTTTLMQGMNLPAQNVIIRNPNLFVKAHAERNPKLSDYEIANLRGRAGRLLKDFIGRSFILDESAFENKEEQSLFSETTKELTPGYEEKYDKYESKIAAALINDETPGKGNQEYAYFLPYIRQTILRHGNQSRGRLQAVGINLPNNVYSKIFRDLSKINVPKEVCYKNRYWDPIDLNSLYMMKKKPVLPKSPRELNIALRIKEIILFMKEVMPYYYDKYFHVQEIQGFDLLLSICINTEKWLKETPLFNILNTKYHDDSDKIEETINILQRTVSYNLPMLLKPFYDIDQDDNMFLNFIEMGAYNPVTRKLIELGIPRETAIALNNKFLKKLNDGTENVEKVIIHQLRDVSNQLEYWEKVQLESII